MSIGPPAPDLHQLEVELQAWILRCRDVPPATIRAGDGSQVYAEAYVLRVTEALGTDYPALRALLGDAGFATLARRYAVDQPSDRPSIRWLGRHLPDYLTGTLPYAAEPYLAELARLEWLLGEAFDAADAPAVAASALISIPAERWAWLRLNFQPSVRRLDPLFEVLRFRRALMDAAPCGLPTAGSGRPVIIWRQGLEVHHRTLANPERVALDAFHGGAAAGDVLGRLVERGLLPAGEAPEALARWLQAWLGQTLVASLSADSPSV